MKLLKIYGYLLGICTILLSSECVAQFSIDAGSTNYTQNFNSLTSGTWSNNSTLTGWYARTTATASIASYGANTGSTTTAGLYAYGIAGTNPLTDRALGFATSNAFTGTAGSGQNFLGWRLKNNTGSEVTSISITYNGEQWRVDNTASQAMNVSYQIASTVTDVTAGTWTNVSGLTFTSVQASGTASQLDGNATANRVANITFTITGISIPNGEEIMIRWSDLNDASNDHHLAIDDVIINVDVAPPVGTSTLSNGAGIEPLNFSSLINTQVAAVQNFDMAIQDDGATPATDATATQISQIRFRQGTGNDIADWTLAIQGAELSDGTNTLSGTVAATTITFTSIPNAAGQLGHIADNATKTYNLKIWLKTDVGSLRTTLDGSNFVFRAINADFTITGSQLAASQDVNSGSSNNAVSVTATAIAFAQNTSNTDVNNNMSPAPTVQAIDANGNRDLDFTSSISITSTGTLNTTPQTVSAILGLATFTINHTATGTALTLTASTSGFSNIASTSFNINTISNSTINSWINSGAATAFFTPTNWSTGAFPASAVVAQWNNTGTAVQCQVNAGTGSPNFLGIEITSARSRNLLIGNNVATNGTITLNGGVINGVANIIIRNNSPNLLTIQDNGGGSGTLGLVLGNSTNNNIVIDSSGGVTIGSIISGSNPIAKRGSGSGILQLTGANTYTGLTTVTEGTLQLNRTGGTTVPTTNNFTIDGGTLRISSNQTLNNLTLSSGNLTIDVGVTLTINGTFTFTGGTITNNGTIAYGASSTLTYNTGDSRTAGVEWPSTSQPANISLLNNSNITLSGNRTIGNFTTTSGTLLAIGSNTLTLNGAISGAGTISGGATSNLTIGGNAGTIAFTNGSRIVRNLVIGTGSNASITLGSPLTISTDGGITFNATGTKSLNTGGNQLLLSGTDGSSAYIGNLNGATITGSITVQRYIRGVARRWRFWGSPFSNATFEDVRDDVYLTGAGTGNTLGTINSNGFDATSTNIPSVFSYNESTAGGSQLGWEALTNNTASLSNQTITAGKGYRIFIRGDRSDLNRLSGTNTTQNQVTIQVSGSINTGNISLPVSYTSTGNPSGDGWNLVANPYPAAFDWNAFYDDGTTTKTNIEPTIWILDATTSSYKSYNANSSGDLTDGIIPMGSAFWVRTNGASPSLILEERFKTGTQPIVLHKSDISKLAITLSLDSITKDTWTLLPEPASTDSLDGLDIEKIQGTISLYSTTQNGDLLALDAQPMQPNDTVNLYCSGGNRTYELLVNDIPNDGYEYVLFDRKTGQTQLLQIGTIYPFTTSQTDSSTFGKRFAIIYRTPQPLPVTLIQWHAEVNAYDAQLLWTTAMESQLSHFEIERAIPNSPFQSVGKVKAAGNSTTLRLYTYTDSAILVKQPRVFYRLKMVDEDGSFTYSSIKSVQQLNSKEQELSYWPNPASDEVNLNTTIGIQSIQVFNANGLLMETSSTLPLQVATWETGLYHVAVTLQNGEVRLCKILKQ